MSREEWTGSEEGTAAASKEEYTREIYIHDDIVVLRSLLSLAVLNYKRSRCRKALKQQVETLACRFQGETSDVAGIGRPRLRSISVFEEVLEHLCQLGFKAHYT